MSDALMEFAVSSNGDRWLLGRDRDSGAAYVLHQANPPSGGARTRVEIAEFLDPARLAPEHRALLVTIGTLVSERGTVARRSEAHPPLSAADPATGGGSLQ
jgi:hypothetical protein